MMSDLLKKSVAFGLGALLVTEQKVKEVVDELVRKGDVNVDEGEKLVRELFQRMTKGAGEVEKKLADVVTRVLGKLEVPSREELKKLEQRIAKLEEGK